eukprot:TRINITY_DN101673_c0_g1_i1.p1 TRINITY_DN101673_c0_g1~~TRINITY_DN101673_c0_g1_i1.p1  ORF type:complete len:158 (-),score=9.65 TRINITY_DN101673_c0_g1_i1:253-726(-)
MHKDRARQLLTGLALFTVAFDVGAEANGTHVWNKIIEPHARLHIVWQLCTNAFMAVVALVIMWGMRSARGAGGGSCGEDEVFAIRLAALMLSANPLGFCFASACRGFYGGTYFPSNVPEYDISVAGIPIALFVFLVLGSAEVFIGFSVTASRDRKTA